MTIQRTRPPAPGESWWLYREPRTDRERLQKASFGFAVDPTQELRLELRERHPDVFQVLDYELQLETEAYASKRTAKAEFSGQPIETSAALPAQVDAMVARYKALDWHPGRIAPADARGRNAFQAAVADGSDGQEAFRQWLRDLEEQRRQASEWAGARSALGMRVDGVGASLVPRPTYSVELDKALRKVGGRA